MVRLISYPFRLASDGSVVTLEEGLDYYADELAMLIKTNPGERELVPEYGLSDPTFSAVSEIELTEKVSLFGPPVTITAVESDVISQDKVSINVIYDESDDDELDGDPLDESDEIDDENDYEEASDEFNFTDATDF